MQVAAAVAAVVAVDDEDGVQWWRRGHSRSKKCGSYIAHTNSQWSRGMYFSTP